MGPIIHVNTPGVASAYWVAVGGKVARLAWPLSRTFMLLERLFIYCIADERSACGTTHVVMNRIQPFREGSCRNRYCDDPTPAPSSDP